MGWDECGYVQGFGSVLTPGSPASGAGSSLYPPGPGLTSPSRRGAMMVLRHRCEAWKLRSRLLSNLSLGV